LHSAPLKQSVQTDFDTWPGLLHNCDGSNCILQPWPVRKCSKALDKLITVILYTLESKSKRYTSNFLPNFLSTKLSSKNSCTKKFLQLEQYEILAMQIECNDAFHKL